MVEARRLRRPVIVVALTQELKTFNLHLSLLQPSWRLTSFDRRLQKREVTIKPMTSTMVALKKRVELCESENRLRQQTGKNIFQLLLLLQKISSGLKKSLVDSVPNKFIWIVVKVENAIHHWPE